MRRLGGLLGGVRIRLTLWYLLILGLVFLVFGTIVYATTKQAAENAAHTQLLLTTQQLLHSYDASDGRLHVADVWADGQPTPIKVAPVMPANTSPLGFFGVAVLLDAQGRVIQQLGPVTQTAVSQLGTWQATMAAKRSLASGAGPASATATLTLHVATKASLKASGPAVAGGEADVPYTVYMTEIQGSGGSDGWLVVAQPDEESQSLQALVPGLLIAGPATLLLAALGGYWLATRAMRPMQLITRTARQIGETDLSRRLNLKRKDELGDLAATFDGMLARLEAAFMRQRQFTADASHELRTPLAIVGLEVERALAQAREPTEYVQVLAVVQAENAYMSRLVNDLLTLARADAGQAAPQWESVDLGDVVLDAVERLAPLARAHAVTLQAGELPEVVVTGDRAYLAQMLTNLVENGIKYTSGVGSRVAVTLGYEADGACIRVADDGPGIPAEHLPHIFERFYRVDEARTHEPAEEPSGAATCTQVAGGSGLGLAIVEWIAQLHGGAVRAHSMVGKGAAFEVWLPDRPQTTPPREQGGGRGERTPPTAIEA
jgi:signal transduction histidine kinase